MQRCCSDTSRVVVATVTMTGSVRASRARTTSTTRARTPPSGWWASRLNRRVASSPLARAATGTSSATTAGGRRPSSTSRTARWSPASATRSSTTARRTPGSVRGVRRSTSGAIAAGPRGQKRSGASVPVVASKSLTRSASIASCGGRCNVGRSSGSATATARSIAATRSPSARRSSARTSRRSCDARLAAIASHWSGRGAFATTSTSVPRPMRRWASSPSGKPSSRGSTATGDAPEVVSGSGPASPARVVWRSRRSATSRARSTGSRASASASARTRSANCTSVSCPR
jgi:hypothetical protein